MRQSGNSHPQTLQHPTGLRQRQLCDYLGLDYRAVAASAKRSGLSTHAYLQQETGWVLIKELYYPPFTGSGPEPASSSLIKPVTRRRRWAKWLGVCGLGVAVIAVVVVVQQLGIEQIRTKGLRSWGYLP